MQTNLLHYNLVLAVFQFAAAAALLVASHEQTRVKWLAALLIGLNGIVSLASAFIIEGAGNAWSTVLLAADLPTPAIIVLLALAVAPLQSAGRQRAATAGLWLAAGLASLGALYAPIAHDPLFQGITQSFGVRASYAFAVVWFARALLTRPSWQMEWLLAAFMVRAADTAVRYYKPPSTAPTPDHVFVWGLGLAILASFAIVLTRRGVGRDARVLCTAAGILGATFALVARSTATEAAAYEESLFTLTAGRASLMVLALLAPGAARPFLRGSLLGVGAYAATVWGAEALRLFAAPAEAPEAALGLAVTFVALVVWRRFGDKTATSQDEPRSLEIENPARPSFSPEQADWERLLILLAEVSPGKGVPRRDIGASLGVEPRNVQRIVDAANRAPGVAPGQQLVEAWFERGRANQLQFAYALTPQGREYSRARFARTNAGDKSPNDRTILTDRNFVP